METLLNAPMQFVVPSLHKSDSEFCKLYVRLRFFLAPYNAYSTVALGSISNRRCRWPRPALATVRIPWGELRQVPYTASATRIPSCITVALGAPGLSLTSTLASAM